MPTIAEKQIKELVRGMNIVGDTFQAIMGQRHMFFTSLPDCLRTEAERREHSSQLKNMLLWCATQIEEEGNSLTLVDPVDER